MSESRTFIAHLRMNRAKIFTVTVVGHEITLAPDQFIPEGHYWLVDREDKRIGYFLSVGGVTGPVKFVGDQTPEQMRDAAQVSERLDQ